MMAMRKNVIGPITGMLVLMAWAATAGADDWTNWRGPAYNGSSAETRLPLKFSKTENIAWVTPLPGRGAGAPIVVGGKVFVSSMDPSSHTVLAICLDRTDGKVLWEKAAGQGRKLLYDRNTMAAPSPVSDGRSVYFVFGSGDIVAYDLDGNVLWTRNIQKEFGELVITYGYSSSPLLWKGKLFLCALRRERGNANGRHEVSFVIAIDPATGKDVWKQARWTDGQAECQEGYSSPIPYEVAGRSAVLVAGADYVTGHDPETGKELWRWGSYNTQKRTDMRACVSPVVVEDIIIESIPQHRPLVAFRPPESGEVGMTAGQVWKRDKPAPDVTSPLLYQGLLYIIEEESRVMTCLDPKTGKEKWHADLGGDSVFRGCPIGGDGKIYSINENGEVIVLAAGEKFEVLNRTKFDEKPCWATIVPANGQLFIRTAKSLYCVGAGK